MEKENKKMGEKKNKMGEKEKKKWGKRLRVPLT
jgi:hypothetical protein